MLDAQRALMAARTPHALIADEPAQRKHRLSLTSVAEVSEMQDADAGRNSPSRVSAAIADTNSNTKIKMVRSSETHDVELEVTEQGLSTTGIWKWRDSVRSCLNLARQCVTRTPRFPTGTAIDVAHVENEHWRISSFVKELERCERATAEERTRKKRDAFIGCLIAAAFLAVVVVAVGLLWSRFWG
jgi:hypothetical protein